MLGLAILAYLRPSDPVHPMRLDFLSLAIPVPLWLIGFVVLGVAGIVFALVLWARKQVVAPPSVVKTIDPASLKIIDLPAVRPGQPQNRLESIPHADAIKPDGEQQIEIVSPDKVGLKIAWHSNDDSSGLLATPVNHSLNAVQKFRVRILSARSYDSDFEDYRDGRSFRAYSNVDPNAVEAKCNGKPLWIVRKSIGESDLLVGNDQGHPLKWPENDHSSVHRWLLSLDFCAEIAPSPQRKLPSLLRPCVYTLVVTWQPSSNKFGIDKIANETPVSVDQ